jgi:hypothetical protein
MGNTRGQSALEPAEQRLPKVRSVKLEEIRRTPNKLGRSGEIVQKRIINELKEMYRGSAKKEKKMKKHVEIDF